MGTEESPSIIDYWCYPTECAHLNPPKYSKWRCYLFGSKGNGDDGAFIYTPMEGNVPNFFVRFMIRICLACTWVKEEE